MVLGASSSSATKSRNSSVGMLARLSLWRMDSTLVGGWFFLAMSDFLGLLRLFQIASDEILRVPRIGNFEERPAAKAAVIVDGGHPQGPRRGDFSSLFFLLLAGHFDDQVQQVIRAVAVVDTGDEVRNIV